MKCGMPQGHAAWAAKWQKAETVQEMLPYPVAGHLNDINTFHAEG